MDAPREESFSAERIQELSKEGEHRFKAKIPPGFEDMNKDVPRRYSDYFIWIEAIEAAKKHNFDLLFVTSDMKPDWYEPGTKLARTELYSEFARRTKKRIWIMPLDEFLSRGTDLGLELAIAPTTIEDVADIPKVETQPVRQFLPDGRLILSQEQMPELPIFYIGILPNETLELQCFTMYEFEGKIRLIYADKTIQFLPNTITDSEKRFIEEMSHGVPQSALVGTFGTDQHYMINRYGGGHVWIGSQRYRCFLIKDRYDTLAFHPTALFADS
jgi:PIN like domain